MLSCPGFRTRIVIFHCLGQDATETSIEIQLFHMKRGDVAFDPNKFYRSILTGDGDDYNDQVIVSYSST